MKKDPVQICMIDKKRPDACEFCKNYSALAEPRERSDGAVIYGYCFKEGDKDYSPGMGKGLAVFIDGGSCKMFKKRRGS